MRRRVQWRRHQHLYGGSWSNDAGVGVEYSDLCRRVLYCCVPAVAKLTKFMTRTTLTGPPSLMARAPVPAAATCASIDIPNSDKSTGTGTGVSTITGGTVAVTWSAGALHARLVRSRAAFAPVCCRRAQPQHPLCSRHDVGALDFPCSDAGYSGSGAAVCTADSGASTSAFVFAGCSGGWASDASVAVSPLPRSSGNVPEARDAHPKQTHNPLWRPRCPQLPLVLRSTSRTATGTEGPRSKPRVAPSR